MHFANSIKFLIILFFLLHYELLHAQNHHSFTYLTKANYATQRFTLDSLYNAIDEIPNEKSLSEFNELKKWAATQNNQELKLNIQLYEFKIAARKNKHILDSISVLKLVDFTNTKDIQKFKFLHTDALFVLACSYFNNKQYALAMRYHYKAHEQYASYNADEFPYLEDYYYEYGRLYYFFKDFKKAASIYKEAWKAIPLDKFNGGRATKMNTLALCYKNLHQYDSAIYYFSKAQKMAIENNEEVWEGILSGNVADIYASQNRYDEAIPLLIKNIEISKKYHQYGDLAQALAALAEIYLKNNNLPKAIENQKLAFDYYCLKKHKDFHIRARLFPKFAKVLAANNQINQSYLFLDSAITAIDSAQKETNLMMIAGVQEKIELEKQQAELYQKESEIANQKKFRNFLIALVVITLAFSIVVFKQRNKISKEQKRSDNLLLNILPVEIAEELKTKGASETRLMENVTVLFTDFKGFADISAKLSPKELVNDLHECFTSFDNIMHKHGLEKIKTIGDAYMAAGGLPTPNNTHPIDVVSAALEIKKFIDDTKQKKIKANQPFFEIRIGVHTGPVVAGIVGVKKFTYDIWGDTVNTASRMESSGEVGKVNISQTTYELVKHKFSCVYRGKIQAKGKGEIDMYFVE
jgi:class 3 adenylate cyclase/tetratricopeptide (TPR) repeat protein